MDPSRRALLLAALAVGLPAVAGQGRKTLTLGLFPNLSPQALFAMYKPMRLHLDEALGLKVELQTAPDFSTYTRRMLAREYDVVVAAPHLARLAQLEAGYLPLASFRTPIRGDLLVARDGPIKNFGDLRGKRLAVPDALALVGMIGQDWLKEAGLEGGRDYQVVYARSHNNAARLVLAGETEAAMVSSIFVARMPPIHRDQLRVIKSSDPVPGQYILASPALSTVEISNLLKGLFGFAASPAGRAFFKEYNLGGLDAATGGELRVLDPYVGMVREALSGKRG